MPIFIHLANLIIPKSIVELKYPGGIKQFKTENDFTGENHNQEDDELFGISRKFIHEYDLGMLIAKVLITIKKIISQMILYCFREKARLHGK